jgi:hypothetical protein
MCMTPPAMDGCGLDAHRLWLRRRNSKWSAFLAGNAGTVSSFRGQSMLTWRLEMLSKYVFHNDTQS